MHEGFIGASPLSFMGGANKNSNNNSNIKLQQHQQLTNRNQRKPTPSATTGTLLISVKSSHPQRLVQQWFLCFIRCKSQAGQLLQLASIKFI